MSLGENLKQDPSVRRHFLIVPTLNLERRHSWGNTISEQDTNMDSIR